MRLPPLTSATHEEAAFDMTAGQVMKLANFANRIGATANGQADSQRAQRRPTSRACAMKG